MTAVIVIPARWASKRFPGKPLADISGTSLLQRTWRIARAVKGVDQVLVATDDLRIKEHVEQFGGQAVMTSADCENGTQRAYDAVRDLNPPPEIVINLQGDAVLTPPWVIQALLDEMKENPKIEIATPATQLSAKQYQQIAQLKAQGKLAGTMVVFDVHFNALYFSRSIIPCLRDGDMPEPPVYRHIGLYAYRLAALQKYLTLDPTPLEMVEKLEQLRALENGMSIKVVPVEYRGRTHWSVDSPDDVEQVERILLAEGELV